MRCCAIADGGALCYDDDFIATRYADTAVRAAIRALMLLRELSLAAAVLCQLPLQ